MNSRISSILFVFVVLSVASGAVASATSTKSAKGAKTRKITAEFCTKTIIDPTHSHELEYCKCVANAKTGLLKDSCTIAVVKAFRKQVQVAATSDPAVSNELMTSFNSMCSLIYGFGTGRGLMCSCDLYPFGSEHHERCSRNAEQLLHQEDEKAKQKAAYDAEKATHQVNQLNQKPMCDWINGLTHQLYGSVLQLTPMMLMTGTFSSTTAAVREFVDNPWSPIIAVGGMGVYIAKCVF